MCSFRICPQNKILVALSSSLLRPVHTREFSPAARSCNTLPEQSPLVCINDFQRKNMLRNKTFAPEFCSLISNWFDMRGQSPQLIASTTHCKLTFKMTVEEEEEDSLQIIHNKKAKKLQ